MTLEQMKKKVLALIEEIDTSVSTDFTNDPDIKAKMPYVINQVMYELARIKKIPAHKSITVDTDVKDTYDYSDIDGTNEIYQLSNVTGIEYELLAQGTEIKFLENGTAEIEYFKYPIRIDETTANTYTFEISADVLEIMPYGVAADLLKSDISNAYGNIYATRYEQLKQQLDIRYNTGFCEIGEGI
ncbi:MAG: hypothetical protein MJZ37_06470 [Bacilli bacterium]|nr:hypothetical protein [Bacilli bacterium]